MLPVGSRNSSGFPIVVSVESAEPFPDCERALPLGAFTEVYIAVLEEIRAQLDETRGNARAEPP